MASLESGRSSQPMVVVIGGAVLDVVSSAHRNLLASTSNPGVIKMQVGGVGRNISEALSHLCVPTLLITPCGRDPAAVTIREWCISNGMRVDGFIELQEARTAVYSALMHHETGELIYGVIDSEIFKLLTIEHLHSFRSHIVSSKWVVLDSNTSPSFLQQATDLCRDLKVPVFFEPVSVQKAQSVADPAVLRGLSIVCPNVREMLGICHKLDASSLSLETYLEEGLKKATLEEYEPYIRTMMKAGVQRAVIVKLGPRGVLVGIRVHDSITFKSFPALKANVVNVLGAGDCLVAGIIYALINDHSIEEAIHYGLVAAKHSVEGIIPVPSALTLDALLHDVKHYATLPKIEDGEV